MPGAYGNARSNDIIPNGPVVPLTNFSVGGSLTLSTYATYGRPAILSVYCTSTFSVSTITGAVGGAPYPANTQLYLPANRDDTLYFIGNGTMSATLWTNRANES